MDFHKKRKVSLDILAARKANREIEYLLYGAGFHSRTKIKKSKKIYNRKRKHTNLTEE